jgi:hypothetical protein
MLACARNGGPSRRRWRCLAPRRRRTYHGAPMPAPHAYDALEAYRGTGTERSRDDGVSTPVDVERCLASDVARRDASRPVFAGGGGTRVASFRPDLNDATGKQTKAAPAVHYQRPRHGANSTPLHPAPLLSSLALDRSRWRHSRRTSSWTRRARRSSPSGSAACAAACTSTRSSPSRSTAYYLSYYMCIHHVLLISDLYG